MHTQRLLAAGALVVGALVGTLAPAAHATAPAAVPHCGNADLAVSYRYSDSAMSHRFGWVVMRNRSSHDCVTGGFGGLSYVGHGNGTQIGAASVRVGGPARMHVLAPGQRLRSAISEATALVYPRGTCRPTHVDGFRVYVPDATRSQYVAHPTTGCANPKVELIQDKAYRRP